MAVVNVTISLTVRVNVWRHEDTGVIMGNVHMIRSWHETLDPCVAYRRRAVAKDRYMRRGATLLLCFNVHGDTTASR